MFWAFASGAANSILEDLRANKASEMEMKEWERRFKIQEEMRAAAEEAQRKNRVINSFEDLNSGKLIETTASGERREMALPQEYVQGARQQTALQAEKERIEREKEERKLAAQLRKDEAAARASESRAKSDRIRAGRTATLMEYDRARTEKARRGEVPEGEKPPSASEKRQQAAAATPVSDEILGRLGSIADESFKAAVEDARREALAETDVIKRLEQLQEIAALVASRSQQQYNPNAY